MLPLSMSDPLWLKFPPFMLDVLEVVDSLVESPKYVATRIRHESEAVAQDRKKLDYLVWQTEWSNFVDSDSSQECRRHSTTELLLWSSDVWMEDRQEPWHPKGLKRQILNLIYKKEKVKN
jgi:hypothetical protein